MDVGEISNVHSYALTHFFGRFARLSGPDDLDTEHRAQDIQARTFQSQAVFLAKLFTTTHTLSRAQSHLGVGVISNQQTLIRVQALPSQPVRVINDPLILYLLTTGFYRGLSSDTSTARSCQPANRSTSDRTN